MKSISWSGRAFAVIGTFMFAACGAGSMLPQSHYCPSATPTGVESNVPINVAVLDGTVGRLTDYNTNACDRAGFLLGDLLEVHTVVTGERGPGMSIIRIPKAFAREDLKPGSTVTFPSDEITVRGCSDINDLNQWSVDDTARETTISVEEGAFGTWEYTYESKFAATSSSPERVMRGTFNVFPQR